MSIQKGLAIKNNRLFSAMVLSLEIYIKGLGFTKTYTPIMETLDIETKNGNEIKSQMFKVMRRGDKEGYDHILRYDQTCGLPKLIQLMNMVNLPIDRYQIGSVFRGERKQLGRYKEFMQLDIDILGQSEDVSVSRILVVLLQTLVHLGVDTDLYKIKILHKNISPQQLLAAKTYASTLHGYELEHRETLSRGHDYYSGPIFEVVLCKNSSGEELPNSIAGGGAFNDYVKPGHKAVGFSIGLERVFECINQDGLDEPRRSSCCIFVHDKSRTATALNIYNTAISKLGKRSDIIEIHDYSVIRSPQNQHWQIKRVVVIYDGSSVCMKKCSVIEGKILFHGEPAEDRMRVDASSDEEDIVLKFLGL